MDRVIDSIALTWGRSLSSPERRARGVAEPVADPIRLDVAALHERFADAGQLKTTVYDEGSTHVGGHWKIGDVELLYTEGRLELRASLPRIITGDLNDVVLDERGVHDALRELVCRGAELADHPLELREAVPTRLDPVIQWEVPSVAFVVEHLKAAFAPARKLRTEWVSPRGGRSIVWGYGSKRAFRFYDKGAAVAEQRAKEIAHGLPLAQLEQMSELDRRRAIKRELDRAREQVWRDAELDTHLRFEIQDRRRGHLRLLHENGYRACDVRRELERAIAALADVSHHDFAAYLDTFSPAYSHRVAYAAAPFFFAQNNAALAVLRTRTSQSSWRRWQRRARNVTLHVAEWSPVIPDDAFDAASSLWGIEERPAA